MNQPADETPEFWRSHSHDDLVRRVAELHRQRRENTAASGEKEVTAARRAVADLFIKGEGIEVGAGARRFPIPSHAQCYYGDIRDQEQLASYFKSKDVVFTGFIDAETFGPIAEGSLDFIISAHVIEHLENPICSILGGLQKLKAAGIYLLVVPDARHTFDRQRPLTSEKHLFADFEDGGAGTRLEAYRDFVRYTAVAEWGEIIARRRSTARQQGFLRPEWTFTSILGPATRFCTFCARSFRVHLSILSARRSSSTKTSSYYGSCKPRLGGG
jgi:hypothetical protein